MKVLVACEFSGIVRDAFIAKGHNAMSCDLIPTERPNWMLDSLGYRHHDPGRGGHYQGDVQDIISEDWDLLIAHPPCRDLAVSGARHFAAKRLDGRQQQSIDFFMLFANSIIPKVAIENPIGIMSRLWRKPDQIIQPWQFGHGETKATCLWLKGLPKLVPTNVVNGREARVHRIPPKPDRWKDRSRTYQGIADAMADQWG